MNRAYTDILTYFAYDHVPLHLQEISQKFHDLAHEMAEGIPDHREVTVSLRKLLEAKDCFVRASAS